MLRFLAIAYNFTGREISGHFIPLAFPFSYKNPTEVNSDRIFCLIFFNR